MVISHSHSQPLLRHRTHDHNDGDRDLLSGAQGSNSSGGSLLPIGGSPLRSHSYDDMITGCIRRRGRDGTDLYFKRREIPQGAGYVSFEDMISSLEFREGGKRPPETAITDPDERTALRLFSRKTHPRHRRRSPGPLGTRRGGAMHRFVKKYVTPCLALVARAFGCMPGMPAR
jgi:hypothetical protein